VSVGIGFGLTGGWGWGVSVGVVSFYNVMVVFTAFVVSWVVSSAQGTFRRRVFLLDTI